MQRPGWIALLAVVALGGGGPRSFAGSPGVAGPVIVSPADGSVVRGGTLRLLVRLPAGAAAVIGKVLVDGKPVEPTSTPAGRGIRIDEEATTSDDDPQLRRLDVPLPPNPGSYAIEVVDGGGASARVRVEVTAVRPRPPRSRLIMLSIGVSNYAVPDLRLRFPAKDARDIAEVFTRQAGLLFSQVNTKLLTDQSADKGQILDGLEWLQRTTTAADVAVLFLAGHGIRDGATGAYYYLPFDADTSAIKRTMVSQEDILTTLRVLPGKVVVFLDTCFAGSLFRGLERAAVEVDSLVQELLQTDSGVVVFLSTTGRQTAREATEWNNGAFTKAVVEGLDGRAAAAPGAEVTVNRLGVYVGDRVKALTGGTQTPTMAIPRGAADFPLAIAAVAPPPPSPVLPPSPTERPRRTWIWAVVSVAAAVAIAGGVTAAVLASEPPRYSPMATF